MRAAPWWRSSTGLGLVLLLAASWEGGVRSGLVQADAWPALSSVGAVFLDRANFVDLWRELAVSIRHMLQGFALGSAFGLVLGVLLGASRPLFRLLEPTLEILRVIPLPALIPPALLLLGGGAEMKISLCAIATFFPVLLNTLHGVRGVDQALVETASTFGVPRTRLVTRVTLPAALPMVLAGLRIALASALITTVVTEMIAGGGGIGLYIVTMQNAARMPEVYAALILMSLVGYALNRSLLALEHRAMPWYTRSE